MKKDYFEMKMPNFKKIKNGSWVISTLILSILLIVAIVLLLLSYGKSGLGSQAQNSLSPQQAGQNVISFLNSHTNGTVQLQNITKISGIYEIDVSYQGQLIPVYATSDGKYLIQSIVPI